MNRSLFGAAKPLAIYADGGSRGNPGHAAIGVVVGGRPYREYVGMRTNNQAEYLALIFGLKKAKQLLGKKTAKSTAIEIKMDSELAVRQLTGRYKIEEPDLQLLFMEAWNLRLDFKSVSFTHIPRADNAHADRLVNEALDDHAR